MARRNFRSVFAQLPLVRTGMISSQYCNVLSWFVLTGVSQMLVKSEKGGKAQGFGDRWVKQSRVKVCA